MANEMNNPLAFAVNNLAILQRDVGEVFKIAAWYEHITSDFHGFRAELLAAMARFRDESELPRTLIDLKSKGSNLAPSLFLRHFFTPRRFQSIGIESVVPFVQVQAFSRKGSTL
jgi:hypothetical protein